MFNKQKDESQQRNVSCASTGSKLMYFMLGGGIGAAIALLFAPKSGREVRQDIADVAVKGYDETLEAANKLRHGAVEYYDTAKERAGDLLTVAGEKISAVKAEISEDTGDILEYVEDAASKAVGKVKSMTSTH
jgi:gas vesicle protein